MVIELESNLNSEHLEQIAELDRTYVPFPWSIDTWKEFNLNDHHELILAKKENSIIGFALLDKMTAPESVHLLKIGVDQSFQKKGCGKLIMNEILKNYPSVSIFLEVAVSNPAVSFYKKLGFEILDTKKKFYSDGEDAYAMLLRS